jgi:hypothetical protein
MCFLWGTDKPIKSILNLFACILLRVLEDEDEDGHTTETCSGYWNKILNNYSNSVALDGNPEPEPDL